MAGWVLNFIYGLFARGTKQRRPTLGSEGQHAESRLVEAELIVD